MARNRGKTDQTFLLKHHGYTHRMTSQVRPANGGPVYEAMAIFDATPTPRDIGAEIASRGPDEVLSYTIGEV